MPASELDEASGETGPSADSARPRRPDEQPIQRTVGRRAAPPAGKLPTAAARAAMTANARYRTRVPKGIYFYETPEQMNRDRERWTVELMVTRQRALHRRDDTAEGEGGHV